MVVATVGAELKDGDKVKRAPVGGVMSEGMLCDGPMLGWAGGGAGPTEHGTVAAVSYTHLRAHETLR